MNLAIVAAMTDARVIGRRGGLPWRLPEDLRRFKRLTMGHTVVMGRRTWESLPLRPLPGRRNVVLSRDPLFKAEGAEVASSLEQAGRGLLFVIGGAELFRLALPLASRLHLTLIHRDFEGDVFFPEWDRRAFEETARSAGRSAEGWDYEFVDFERKTAGDGMKEPQP